MHYGNYSVIAFTTKTIIEGKKPALKKDGSVKKNKDGSVKLGSFPNFISYIYLSHVQGDKFKFVGTTKSKILSFSDSRDATANTANKSRLSEDKMRDLLVRFLKSESAANEVWTTMKATEMSSQEGAALAEHLNAEIEASKLQLKTYNELTKMCNRTPVRKR